jgi:dihydroneopterin aldolase
MKTIEKEPAKPVISKIHLSGMEFYAHHGCFMEERQVGAHFKVDLILESDTKQAAQTDKINDAVNYQTVYAEVKEIMQHPVNLLETLSNNILLMVKEKFPQVTNAEVTVYKMNPALGGKVGFVSVNSGYD